MKEVYSLKELVKDIYGVEENVGLGNTFEANYKELQRLDKVIRQNSNYSNLKGILAVNKERYVNFIKDIISNSELKKSVEDLNKGKKISYEKLQAVIEVYLKYNDDLRFRVERYNYMHNQVEIIQGKSIGILKAIIEYFNEEELLLVEEMIFNDTLKKIENVTSEYKRQIEMICNDAIKTCQYYDKIEDRIYISKLMKTLIPSIESKKFMDQYNKEIKKRNNTK